MCLSPSSTDRRQGQIAGSAAARHPAEGSTRRLLLLRSAVRHQQPATLLAAARSLHRPAWAAPPSDRFGDQQIGDHVVPATGWSAMVATQDGASNTSAPGALQRPSTSSRLFILADEATVAGTVGGGRRWRHRHHPSRSVLRRTRGDRREEPIGPNGAPGRLLRWRLGANHAASTGYLCRAARRRADRRRARCRGGGRRRPHPASHPGPGEPRLVDARLVGPAPEAGSRPATRAATRRGATPSPARSEAWATSRARPVAPNMTSSGRNDAIVAAVRASRLVSVLLLLQARGS